MYGSDGTTEWEYDPLSRRYSLDTSTTSDPRAIALGAYGPTVGTTDFASALAALQRLPTVAATREGTDRVANRDAERILTRPAAGCGTNVPNATPSGNPTDTPPTPCGGFHRYWLDAATGWVLRLQSDDGAGVRLSLDTMSVDFHAPIDSALFHFTPPPGSSRVSSSDLD